MKTTIHTITPKFPDQNSIDQALSALSDEDRQHYDLLQQRYSLEIQKPQPNHETIESLITEANEILVSAASTTPLVKIDGSDLG